MTQPDNASEDLITLTAEVVAAHVANNRVPIADMSVLISSVYAAFADLRAPKADPKPKAAPAVSIRASIKHDYLVCLEDGKRVKMLKRYLMTNFQLTPEQYRTKWNLPSDYPMASPAYTETRRALAKQFGLGRKPAAPVAATTGQGRKPKTAVAAAERQPAPRRRGRPKLSVKAPVE